MNLNDVLKIDFQEARENFFYIEGYIYNFDISKLSAEDLFYKIKNENFLAGLSGEFYLAVWNKESKELILARDKVGVKPIFYIKAKNTMYISSNMKKLVDLGLTELTTDTDFLKNIKIENFSFISQTPWKEIKKNPPSTYILFNSHEEKYVNYWNVLLKDSKLKNISPSLLLEQIIEERANAQKSVGIFLSSGFDSTALCFLAAKSNTKCDINLYSLDFKSESASESSKLEKILTLLKFKASKLLYEDIPNESLLPYPNEEHAFVFYNPNLMLFKPLFEKAYQENKKVIWTGLGGDDIFSSYPSIMSKLFSISKILWVFAFYIKNILLFWSSRKYYFNFSFFKNALQTKSPTRFRLLEKLHFSSALTFAIEAEQHLANKFGMQMSYPLLDDRLIQCYADFLLEKNKIPSFGSKPFLRSLVSGIVPEFLRAAESKQSYGTLWRTYLVKNQELLFGSGRNLEVSSPLDHYYENLHDFYSRQVESISFRSGTQ